MPNKIIASGNTSFKNNDISITSNDFNYDISTATGAFQDNVKINYKMRHYQATGSILIIKQKTFMVRGKSNSIRQPYKHHQTN